MAHRFKALQTFEDAELKSVYVQGKTYTIRKHNYVLARKVSEWLISGKVAIVVEEHVPDRGRITGRGDIK
jgi:hypothetical protein